MPKDGIVDVQMIVINKLVCENLSKGLEFSQPLLWRWKGWEGVVLGLACHGIDIDREMMEGGDNIVHIRFVDLGGSSLSSLLTDPFLFLP